jgi:hypothetical protein
LGKIPKKIGYLGMGIGYNTQKNWVFGYGYWVKYPKKLGIWVWVLGIIPKKIGYLGMGIGYNTPKKWVFGYGYWVSCGYHTQYPIPIKKVGTDV